MIKSFRHKGLQAFFDAGSKAGIQPHHASKLNRQLLRFDVAKAPSDVNLPDWDLHLPEQDLVGHHSIWVNENWRITFKFEGEDVILVDYQDNY